MPIPSASASVQDDEKKTMWLSVPFLNNQLSIMHLKNIDFNSLQQAGRSFVHMYRMACWYIS